MKFECNEKGEFFYKRSKREIKKLIFISPFVICLLTLLYVIGAKNEMHLIFAIVMSFILFLIIAFGFVSLLQKTNLTVREIVVNSDEIIFSTFSILSLGGKTYKIEKKYPIGLREENFYVFNNKQISKGYHLTVEGHNLKIINDFFDVDINEYLTGLA